MNAPEGEPDGDAGTLPPAEPEALLRVERTLLLEPGFGITAGDTGLRPGCCVSGVIEALPEVIDASIPVARRSRGERVVVDPVLPCGLCTACRGGLAAICPTRSILGMRGRDGGCAEFMRAPLRNLIPAPDSIDRDLLPFALPVASVMALGRRLGVSATALVTVLGDGPMALLATAVLREIAPRVRLLADGDHAAEIAARWSLRHRGRTEAGLRRDQDVVVIADPGADGFDLAMALLRPRGRIGVLPGAATAVPGEAFLQRLCAEEGSIVGGAFAPVSMGLDLLQRRPVDLGLLAGAPMPLGSPDEARSALRGRKIRLFAPAAPTPPRAR